MIEVSGRLRVMTPKRVHKRGVDDEGLKVVCARGQVGDFRSRKVMINNFVSKSTMVGPRLKSSGYIQNLMGVWKWNGWVIFAVEVLFKR